MASPVTSDVQSTPNLTNASTSAATSMPASPSSAGPAIKAEVHVANGDTDNVVMEEDKESVEADPAVSRRKWLDSAGAVVQRMWTRWCRGRIKWCIWLKRCLCAVYRPGRSWEVETKGEGLPCVLHDLYLHLPSLWLTRFFLCSTPPHIPNPPCLITHHHSTCSTTITLPYLRPTPAPIA